MFIADIVSIIVKNKSPECAVRCSTLRACPLFKVPVLSRRGMRKSFLCLWWLVVGCSGFDAYAEFDCNQYRHEELKSICSQFGQNQITVHSHIDSHSLNQWKNTIGDQSGLHIIPAKQYVLTETLKFGDRQGVLPAPSGTESQSVGVIQLTFVSGFADTNSAVLRLGAGSKAGGFFIAPDDGLINSQSLPGFSLVSLEETKNVELVLSYFGVSGTASVNSLINIKQLSDTDADNDEVKPVLSRILLSAGSSPAGIKAKLLSGRRVKFNNCLLAIDSKQKGIELEGGTAELLNSEVYLRGDCQSCGSALQSDGSRVVTTRSFFWSDAWGSVISEKLYDNYRKNQTSGWMLDNLLTHGLDLVESGQPVSDLIVGDNYSIARKKVEKDLISWDRFQGYKGLLGIARLPSGLMAPSCNNTTPAHKYPPEMFQQPVSFSQAGFQQKELVTTSGFNSICSSPCPDVVDWPTYLMLSTIPLALVTNLACIVVARYFGLKHRVGRSYIPLNNPVGND